MVAEWRSAESVCQGVSPQQLLHLPQITSQRFAQDRCDEWRKTNRENHNHVSAYPRSIGAGREATEYSVLYL